MIVAPNEGAAFAERFPTEWKSEKVVGLAPLPW
jgi:hypothetical protein